ncbi:hypothetical protein VOLCADRAFT_96531 [Volvox carteri f. nagariensis]|uniref:ABM domain-containing protein n=1 Tax=Volvox carteri f. nagariensis TaxID=3068 RepID=D8UAC7_VOLCA|nr:uncharacterized protein VOLCADRAFT_96531 [Volvox carteri f. nagariensis]EFJ43245.1 hypothetical protein VOLCADRAFT_96531 [Volvox carteri f. nagariensis]|eukprot:XP_002955605.1 hypothetical protein VOLCADRAFT_96531 [Volvox carteri f. nagariensis]
MSPSRRVPLLVAAPLLLLLCVGASAYRSPAASSLHRTAGGTTTSSLKAIEWLMRRGGEGMENRPAYLLIKYEVPPTLHDRFIEELDRHDKVLRDVKGLSFYQKTKDMDDNVMFCSYTEWDTVGDLMDHCESTAFKDFHNWVDDNDILVEMFPLEALGDEKREYRADREGEKAATAARAAAAKDLERRRRRGREIEEFDPREETAHFAIRFHIMPSQEEDFLNFVQDVQKRVVKDEDENRFFVLRKFATMNHHYLIRGAWDTFEGYLDHITSKHSMNLRGSQMRYAKDNNIEWYGIPFRVLYTSEDTTEYKGLKLEQLVVSVQVALKQGICMPRAHWPGAAVGFVGLTTLSRWVVGVPYTAFRKLVGCRAYCNHAAKIPRRFATDVPLAHVAVRYPSVCATPKRRRRRRRQVRRHLRKLDAVLVKNLPYGS